MFLLCLSFYFLELFWIPALAFSNFFAADKSSIFGRSVLAFPRRSSRKPDPPRVWYVLSQRKRAFCAFLRSIISKSNPASLKIWIALFSSLIYLNRPVFKISSILIERFDIDDTFGFISNCLRWCSLKSILLI